jgi:hypothetical protein
MSLLLTSLSKHRVLALAIVIIFVLVALPFLIPHFSSPR